MAKKTKKAVTAECHSDDRVFEVTFDASSFFDKASDEEIVALMECGWGGDYPADNVAESVEESNESIRELFSYVRRVKDMGFECHVNEEEAIAYLKIKRPHLNLED